MKRAAIAFAGLALAAMTAYSGDGNVHRSTRRIPGRYIVVLEPGADGAAVADFARSFKGARIGHSYQRGVSGFSVEVDDAGAVALARDPRVKFVEEDAAISAAETPWGLDRIDQRSLPLNGTYVSAGSGAGVSVYIVDTGIAAGHSDFGGRVAAGFGAIADGNGTSDCNGHGTHVAGIVGGAQFGVASGVTLVPVRVLDCKGSGSLSDLLAGLDWVLADQTRRPAVVNMSLGGDASSALDAEVDRLLAAGLTTVIAAGNGNTDACNTSPARVPGALTVGATGSNDQRAGFSNYGNCIDLFAPGANIVSDWYSSPTATAVSSGTSEAAPFVAGTAALLLEKHPDASVASVSQTILARATIGAVSGEGNGSPNRLLFALIDAIDDVAAGDSQLIPDPGFDYGTTFWASDICTVINPTGCPPSGDDLSAMSLPSRSGNTKAALGGAARSAQLISEAVTIPAAVSKAELSFYLWIVTKNQKKTADDVITIEVRDAAGQLVEVLGTFSNLDACPDYILRRFDVSRYRGATVRLSFTVSQENGPPTWFLVDDVALNIWR